MKFVVAHQNVEDLVAELENLIQSGTYRESNLIVVTLEEHADNLKSMVPTDIETVKEKDFKENKPLDYHGLDKKAVELYDDILKNGGYVVFEKNVNDAFSNNDNEKERYVHSNSDEIDLHAPGFGVDIDDPNSSDKNHEDNFNPDNPNPEADR